ncbi:MAG: hypothetical protein AAF441_03815 [Pseudomonadota bacterium]
MKRNENTIIEQQQGTLPRDVEQGALRVAIIAAACLFLASHVENVFVAAVMHSLLLLAASASAIGAALRVENPLAPVLTRWDEAMMLTFLALISFKLVDAQAVEDALIVLQHSNPG